MSFERIKSFTQKFGLYRAARWVHRHLLNRGELRTLQDELAFYSQFLAPGSLCFDVGANFGAKAEVFLRLGAKVIAFEPQRDCIQELQARLGAHPRLVPIQTAVGSNPGQMTLYIGRHSTVSSLVKNWEKEVVGSMEVPVTTLDDAISKFGVPQFCKIDVEGFELEVLKGLSQAIPAMSFEYHLWGEGLTQALACLEYLSTFGNLLLNITPAERLVFAGQSWWDLDSFMNFLRRDVPQMHGHSYGDIFVKIQGIDCHASR